MRAYSCVNRTVLDCLAPITLLSELTIDSLCSLPVAGPLSL